MAQLKLGGGTYSRDVVRNRTPVVHARDASPERVSFFVDCRSGVDARARELTK
jgi:hypothetical protein